MDIQSSVTTTFSFLEQEYGFVRKPDSESADRHIEYFKDPLSVDIWWGKGEIDVMFIVSLPFSKSHAIFRPYISRTFDLAEIALRDDPNALEPLRSLSRQRAGYIIDTATAQAYVTRCAEIMRRHCTPLLTGNLAVLEQLTMERRAHAQRIAGAEIILASGFTGATEIGDIPERVAFLARLDEPVRLVRANESVNFHLAAKAEPIRSDTAIFRWIVENARNVVEQPEHFFPGRERRHFQLLRRIEPTPKYPSMKYLRFLVKFVPSQSARSGHPELWLSSVVLHDELSVDDLEKGERLGV